MSRRLLLCLATLAALTACADDSSDKPTPNKCPQVATVRDLSIYQVPAVADNGNLVLTARMGNIVGMCSYDSDGNEVQGSFDVVAQRGPNTAGKRAVVPFFVSVLDPQENVVHKETYELPLVFDEGQRSMKMTVPLNPKIGVPNGMEAQNYRVLIGFQLSEPQVNANRAFFGAPPPATARTFTPAAQ